jgi:hypothetical protein
VSPQDQACAAFFVRIVLTFCLESRAPSDVDAKIGFPIRSRADADAIAKRWFDAADLCWGIMRDTFSPAAVDPEFAQALAIVGEYIENQARVLEGKNNILVFDRSSRQRGDDRIRVSSRLISDAAYSIFGSHMYGTVAKVVNVVLEENVTWKQVCNWTKHPSK